MVKKIYKIERMHCASCAKSIERAVKKIKGIKEASVNFATKKLYVEAEKINDENIINAVSKAGDYKAMSEKEEEEWEKRIEEEKEQDMEIIEMEKAKKRMWLSWLFAVPIAIISLVIERIFEIQNFFITILPLILAFPILFVIGYPTVRSAVKSIKYFSFNMDVLISLGTIIAFLTGVLRFFMPIEDYSGIGGMI